MHFVWNHDRKTSIQYHVTRENIQQTCSSSCIAWQHCVGAHMNAHKHTQRINEQHEGVDPRKKILVRSIFGRNTTMVLRCGSLSVIPGLATEHKLIHRKDSRMNPWSVIHRAQLVGMLSWQPKLRWLPLGKNRLVEWDLAQKIFRNVWSTHMEMRHVLLFWQNRGTNSVSQQSQTSHHGFCETTQNNANKRFVLIQLRCRSSMCFCFFSKKRSWDLEQLLASGSHNFQTNDFLTSFLRLFNTDPRNFGGKVTVHWSIFRSTWVSLHENL